MIYHKGANILKKSGFLVRSKAVVRSDLYLGLCYWITYDYRSITAALDQVIAFMQVSSPGKKVPLPCLSVLSLPPEQKAKKSIHVAFFLDINMLPFLRMTKTVCTRSKLILDRWESRITYVT